LIALRSIEQSRYEPLSLSVLKEKHASLALSVPQKAYRRGGIPWGQKRKKWEGARNDD